MSILQQSYKKMNLYFFGDEEICLHDFVWFYGFLAFITLMGLLVMTVNVIGGLLS